jgi:type IV secretion system protein VirD4
LALFLFCLIFFAAVLDGLQKRFEIANSFFLLFGNPGTAEALFCLALAALACWRAAKLLRERPYGDHGSARWAGKRDAAPLKSRSYPQNILLTKTERIALTADMGGPKRVSRNNNVLVVGASGAGKSRGFVKPQIYQAYSSYVVTDPKGALYPECGEYLSSSGYSVRLFSLIDMDSSEKYNPLSYVESTDDILKLTESLIQNTQGKDEEGDFWKRAEAALFEAVFAYLVFENRDRPQEATLRGAVDMISSAQDEDGKGLDLLFDSVADQSCFACRQYRIFKLAPARTAAGILISAAVRLAAFNIPEIASLTSSDTVGLGALSESKSALFIAISDADPSKNFIAALLYQQLFDILVRQAAKNEGGRLKEPVTFLLDEFANIGKIPRFDVLIATMRSRGAAIMLCCQSMAQLKAMYPQKWEIIAGNCDCLLYLGGMEKSTHDYVSEMCGQTTALQKSVSLLGMGISGTSTNSSFRRALITPDEVARLPSNRCILLIAGLSPFLSRKFPLERHPALRKFEKGKKRR